MENMEAYLWGNIPKLDFFATDSYRKTNRKIVDFD